MTEADTAEQLERIRKLGAETNLLSLQLQLQLLKTLSEALKTNTETGLLGRNSIFQAMTATAALIGAGAVIAKVLFP